MRGQVTAVHPLPGEDDDIQQSELSNAAVDEEPPENLKDQEDEDDTVLSDIHYQERWEQYPGLQVFLHQFRRFTNVREHNDQLALFSEYHTSGRLLKFRDTIVYRNIRLVAHWARRYMRKGSRIAITDLLQEGTIGLTKAVERFDPARGYRFSTYATWWIRHFIERNLMDDVGRNGFRVPVHAGAIVSVIRRAQNVFVEQYGRTPGAAELLLAVRQMPLKVAESVTLRDIGRYRPYLTDEIVSTDESVASGGGTARTHYDRIPDQTMRTDETVDIARQLEKYRRVFDYLLTEIQALPERYRTIIELRCGLGGDDPYTLDRVANERSHLLATNLLHGTLTRERVRQLENAGYRLLKARTGFGRAELRAFLLRIEGLSRLVV